MKLSEYVTQVINDPKYGHDIEWVRGNLYRGHLEAIEAARDAEIRAGGIAEGKSLAPDEDAKAISTGGEFVTLAERAAVQLREDGSRAERGDIYAVPGSGHTPPDDEREMLAQWLHLRFGKNQSYDWGALSERHRNAWRNAAADALRAAGGVR